VSTDTGHAASNPADASFASDQQAKLNYAYAAIGKVAVRAKSMIAALAGRAPSHSYFAGCSNGGREGLLMTQRYPELFDGVLAGNPAFNLRDAAVLSYYSGMTYAHAARRDPASGGVAARLVTPAEGELIRNALLERCDGLDGARDGMIFNHTACRFDVRALACKPGSKAGSCLAPAKAEAIARAFAGPHDAAGRPLFTPWTWDSAVFTPDWLVWQTGVVQPDGKVMTMLRDLVASSLTQYFAYPRIDPALLSGTEADLPRLLAATAHTGAMTAATSTDLTTFAARGGKLMITDGWSDPIFSARDLVRWYERMAADMETAGARPAASFARLYMVPGMAHCGGGKALDDMDALSALVDWVEAGKAPDALVATGAAFPGVSRPMCAWPKTARYDGKGPIDAAASFRCESEPAAGDQSRSGAPSGK
jgi:feruloyl esterase